VHEEAQVPKESSERLALGSGVGDMVLTA
jgi:hypothetical protein